VFVVIPAVHGGVPWGLSHLGPRYGWADGSPSGWNLLGYAVIAAGAALLVWLMLLGLSRYRELPERVPLEWRPVILMTGGPYAFCRHPMYIAELGLWLGVAVLFGSPVVLVGFVAMFAVMRQLAVWEERALETKFGEPYRQYKARVPRWIGLPRGARKETQGEKGTS
jgi:protein-S-isoprenylcysteine O-methyltransferase Ste14